MRINLFIFNNDLSLQYKIQTTITKSLSLGNTNVYKVNMGKVQLNVNRKKSKTFKELKNETVF